MANTFRNHNDQNGTFMVRNNEGTEFDDFFERNPDVHLWDPEQVRKWLVANHLDDLTGDIYANYIVLSCSIAVILCFVFRFSDTLYCRFYC